MKIDDDTWWLNWKAVSEGGVSSSTSGGTQIKVK